jgi:hypothetical protein
MLLAESYSQRKTAKNAGLKIRLLPMVQRFIKASAKYRE